MKLFNFAVVSDWDVKSPRQSIKRYVKEAYLCFVYRTRFVYVGDKNKCTHLV